MKIRFDKSKKKKEKKKKTLGCYAYRKSCSNN